MQSRTWSRLAIFMALSLPALFLQTAQAGPGCCSPGGSSGSTHTSASDVPAKPRLMGREPLSSRPPHNGKISKGSYQSFEVVYLPHETRVYIYSPTDWPAKAKDAQGQITMQVKGNPTLYQYPLRYLPPIPGSEDGDCLHAIVDVTQIRDGDMQVTVELWNLPYDRQEPSARFQQVFAITRLPEDSDRPLVSSLAEPQPAIQQVSNTSSFWKFWRRKKAAPAAEGDAPCCDDCKREADLSVRQVTQQDRLPYSANRPMSISAQPATADDQFAIEAQRFCPVMRQPLGARGAPWRVLVDGQPVFVCCRECVSQVETQPGAYLAEARRLRGW